MKNEHLLAIAAALALYFYTRKASAATPTEPGPVEPQEPAGPTEPAGPDQGPPPDGYHPTPEPTQGYFYQVMPGDILSRIVVRAGLPPRAHMVATAHPANAWIKQLKQEDGTYTLKLWPRYVPAYQGDEPGQYLSHSAGSLPVVYVPTQAEYEARK